MSVHYDVMTKNNVIGRSKIYQLGKELGLQERDVDEVIETSKEAANKEMPSPMEIYPSYPSMGYYGTISIKDLRKLER